MTTTTPQKTVLLVDDDPNMHLICRKIIEKRGWNFLSAFDGAEGLQTVKSQGPDVILLDYMMPEVDGYSFFQQLRNNPDFQTVRHIPVIMLTVISENHPKRKKLFNTGLSLYLHKPFGSKELINIIDNVFVTDHLQKRRRASERRRIQKSRKLAQENRELRTQLAKEAALDRIIGTTPKLQAIFDRIQKVAPTDANVLITGESGTGKELVARAIHECSNRSEQPFVAVDCVALPGTLIESELFGYEKGAFTGATGKRQGLFELANGGTLFLDEIAELSIGLQAKLLRFLQERQIRHIGGKDVIEVNVRIISATNQEPWRAIENGNLREDLFYRLNVVPIHMPALRDRQEDIPVLIEYFSNHYSKKHNRAAPTFSDDALQLLENYSWPGNVRELQNIIERLVSLNSGTLVTPDDLPHQLHDQNHQSTIPDFDTSGLPLKDARKVWLSHFEKRYLVDLLTACDGNISEVARQAGVNRMTIYRMLKQYNINLKLLID